MAYLKRLHFPIFFLRLRQATRRCYAIDDYLSVAMNLQYKGWHIRPNQVRSEIRALLDILAEKPPAYVLEIGTADGGSLYLLSAVSARRGQLMSIDLPAYRSPLRSILLRSLASRNQRIYLLSGNSQGRSMRDRVQRRLGGKSLDFLFIDGDHTYDGAKRDFGLYRRLVGKGGLIAFHDIVPGPVERVGGVPGLWKELKNEYPSQELVEDWKQGGWGIGLIRLPEPCP